MGLAERHLREACDVVRQRVGLLEPLGGLGGLHEVYRWLSAEAYGCRGAEQLRVRVLAADNSGFFRCWHARCRTPIRVIYFAAYRALQSTADALQFAGFHHRLGTSGDLAD